MSGSRLRSGRNSVIVIIVILISLISFVTLFNSVSRENDLVLKIEKLEQANEAIFKLVEGKELAQILKSIVIIRINNWNLIICIFYINLFVLSLIFQLKSLRKTNVYLLNVICMTRQKMN